MAKTMEIVVSTLMPMSWAAALSSEQARMALPILVRWVKNVSATMTATQASTVTMVTDWMRSCPPKSSSGGRSTTLVKTFGSDFMMSSAEFCKKYDTPMAVIRTASDGAPRRGL